MRVGLLSPTPLPHRSLKRCIVVIGIEDTIDGCVLGSCSADIRSIRYQDIRGLFDSLGTLIVVFYFLVPMYWFQPPPRLSLLLIVAQAVLYSLLRPPLS